MSKNRGLPYLIAAFIALLPFVGGRGDTHSTSAQAQGNGATPAGTPAEQTSPTPAAETSGPTHYEGRPYRLYTPAALEGVADAPLVVVLHGAYGTGDWIEQNLRLNAEADRLGFRVAYLNGIRGVTGVQTWNAGNGCCGAAFRRDIDDVAYITGFIRHIAGSLPSSRIAIVGQSNGGAMAYRLACEAPDVAGSFVSISGPLMVDECQPSTGNRFLHIHGENDANIPIGGGIGQGDRTITWNSVEHSQAALEQAGVAFTLITVPQAAHSLDSFQAAATSQNLPSLAERIGGFVAETFPQRGAATPTASDQSLITGTATPDATPRR